MRDVASCAVCLHNMIVEEWRDFYHSDGSGGMSGTFMESQDTTDITSILYSH